MLSPMIELVISNHSQTDWEIQMLNSIPNENSLLRAY